MKKRICICLDNETIEKIDFLSKEMGINSRSQSISHLIVNKYKEIKSENLWKNLP